MEPIKYLGVGGTKAITAKIKDKVLQYDTKASFEADLAADKIANDSVVFINDTDQLYFGNRYYGVIPKDGKEKQILQWKASGEAEWADLANAFNGLEDILAYGVRIDQSIADPHLTRIGNTSLHKTLPIQSQLKGCIAQGNKIQYWLDEKDWRFRKNPITITAALTVNTSGNVRTYTLAADIFSTLQYEAQYVQINGNIAQVTSIDTINKVATIVFQGAGPAASNNSIQVVLGSVRNGYDGNVCVYVPNFYIASKKVSDTVYDIFISTVKIDDSYQYQHEGLLGAYRATVLNEVPKNMGYLSSLPANSAVSVVNTNSYCRGGSNNTNYDQYFATDKFRTQLGKSRTGLAKPAMREFCKNGGSRMLDYNTYKNVMYWLYVVEYANFNCQENYSPALTSEGYRQGGLSAGVTIWNSADWSRYNETTPIIPCGYGDSFGNGTSLLNVSIPTTITSNNITVPSTVLPVPRWRGFDNPFGDIFTHLDGCICDTSAFTVAGSTYATFYIFDDPANFTDSTAQAKTTASRIYSIPRGSGYQGIQHYGDVADMVPKDISGNSSQKICDYYSISTTLSTTTLLVGGGADTQSYAGLAAFYVQAALSVQATNIGFRFFYDSVSLSELKS